MVVVIGAGAVVCKTCNVAGDVVVGAGTVVHPHTTIASSSGGKLVMGDKNIVEEFSVLKNDNSSKEMRIGANNVFEVGCVVESSSMGDGNIIQARAKVLAGCSLGSGCVIGVGVVVPAGTSLPDNTVLFKDANHRRTVEGLKERNTRKCLEEIALVVGQNLLSDNHKLLEVGEQG